MALVRVEIVYKGSNGLIEGLSVLFKKAHRSGDVRFNEYNKFGNFSRL